MITVFFIMQCENCQDFFERSAEADGNSPRDWSGTCSALVAAAEKCGWHTDGAEHLCPECLEILSVPEEEVCPCCR